MATVDIFSPSVRKERSAMDRIHEEVSRLRRAQTASEIFSTRNVRAEVPQRPPIQGLTGTLAQEPDEYNERAAREQQAIIDELLESVSSGPNFAVTWDRGSMPVMTEQEEREMEEDLANMQTDWPDHTEDEEVW